MVTGQPPAVRAPRRLHRAWSVPLAVIGLAPMVAVIGTSFIPSTAFISKNDCIKTEREADNSVKCLQHGPTESVEFAVVPADAEPAGPRLTLKGVKKYDSTGHILFVTVRQPELQLFEYFLAKGNPGTTGFYSYSDVYGSVTPDQDRVNAFRDMRDAKRDAYFVGLQKLGYPVKLVEGAAVIQQLTCLAQDDTGKCTKRSPAAELLQANDQLDSIDGKAIKVASDLSPILATYKPGATITIDFTRSGTSMSGSVLLIANPSDATKALIGIQLADTSTVSIPDNVVIDYNTDGIGGPSAGLSFTLTLIDELSAGDLTGGQKVAVTGTIDVNGDVGAIGGLQSKGSAVKQAGAKYFIVPESQGPEDIARAQKSAGPGVTIIPVKTLDEALAALQKIGGDPLVQPPEATTPAA
jgi:PDZ domain-containing protein